MSLHSLQQILVFNCGFMISPVNISFLVILKHLCVPEIHKNDLGHPHFKKIPCGEVCIHYRGVDYDFCVIKGYFEGNDLTQGLF